MMRPAESAGHELWIDDDQTTKENEDDERGEEREDSHQKCEHGGEVVVHDNRRQSFIHGSIPEFVTDDQPADHHKDGECAD